MKKYLIPVGNKGISEQVQEALFRAGFKWHHDGPRVRQTGDAFIVLHCNTDMCLASGSGSTYHSQEVRDGRFVLISSQEVIANPFQLDGAKNPVKEMTVAELYKALGYPVKIIKG
jgi:hypothetical protein